LTATSFTNTGLAASSTHFYVLEAVDANGPSAASAQLQASTTAAASTFTEIVAINSGGPAVSNATAATHRLLPTNFTMPVEALILRVQLLRPASRMPRPKRYISQKGTDSLPIRFRAWRPMLRIPFCCTLPRPTLLPLGRVSSMWLSTADLC
jgi:hypothetical protein